MAQKQFQQQIQQKVKTVRKNIQNLGFQVPENAFCTLLMYNLYLLGEQYLTKAEKQYRLCCKIPRQLYFESQNKGSGQIILQTALQQLWQENNYIEFQSLELQQQLKIYSQCLQQLYMNDAIKRYNFYINKDSFPNQDKIDKAIKLLQYFHQYNCDDLSKAEYVLNYQTQSKIHIPKVFLIQNPTPQQLSILLSPKEYILTTKQISPKQFIYHIKGTTHIYDGGINQLNYNIYRQKLQNIEYYTDEAETYQLVKNNQFKKPILPLQYFEDSYFFNEMLDINDYLVSDQILEKMQNFKSIQEIRKQQENNTVQSQLTLQINDQLSEQINRAYNLCKMQQKNKLQFTLDKHVWNTLECIDNYNAKSQIFMEQQGIPIIARHSMTNLIAQNGILIAGQPLQKIQNNQKENVENQIVTMQLKFSGRPDLNIKVQQNDLLMQRNKNINIQQTIQLKEQQFSDEYNLKVHQLRFQQSRYIQQLSKILPKEIIQYLRNEVNNIQNIEDKVKYVCQYLINLNIQPSQSIICQVLYDVSYNIIRSIVQQSKRQTQQLATQFNNQIFYNNYDLDQNKNQVIQNIELSKQILEQITKQIQCKCPLKDLFIVIGKQFKLQPDIIFDVFMYYNNQYQSKIASVQKQ